MYKRIVSYCREFGIKSVFLRGLDELRRDISYGVWYRRNKPSEKELEGQRRQRFAFAPKISVVVPLYRTPERYLTELVSSVKAQTYGNWELCLSDGSGEDSPIRRRIEAMAAEDDRIRVVSHERKLRIAENTNAALAAASGDYIAFADHDDLLAPDALYQCVSALNDAPETELLYTDEDKVDGKGRRHFAPHFKPDFNMDMLRSVNYICHLFVVKRELCETAGGMDPAYDGAQDYDFVLRCVERTAHIRHIPEMLYHWRTHRASTSGNPGSKDYAFEAGARALRAHYERMGLAASVSGTGYSGIYRTRYGTDGQPLVSVIAPGGDHGALREKLHYRNIEFAASAAESRGDYLLFVGKDTEPVTGDCIEEMLGYCRRSDVGAVGAKLYHRDGTIRHAGIIIGLRGTADCAFRGLPGSLPGYGRRAVMAQDCSAVTSSCMMMKKEVFRETGGYDRRLSGVYRDADLCLRLRRAGYLIVYDPWAEFRYLGRKAAAKASCRETAYFLQKWKSVIAEGDPYYNPNLTLKKSDLSVSFR